MITTQEKIGRLEALLTRVTARALEPRAPRVSHTQRIEVASAAAVEAALDEAPIAVSLGPAIEPVSEPIVEAPADLATTLDLSPEPEPSPVDLATTIDAVEPQELAAAAIDLDAPFDVVEGAPSEPPREEASSGEFAVAKPAVDVAPDLEVSLEEAPLELEELGPADELGDEPVVEIHIDDEPIAAAAAPAVEPISLDDAAADAADDDRAPSSPPESGRELVASPHESARLAVAAPSTPDVHGLDLVEEPVAPPESSRNLRAAPAVPSTSDVVGLDPPVVAEAEPIEAAAPEAPIVEAPIVEAPAVEAPAVTATDEASRDSEPPVTQAPYSEPPPTRASFVPSIPSRREEPIEAAPAQQAAVAVRLDAPQAHAPREVEHVVVAIAADVVHPQLTPIEVAAFVGAARAPRPETFGGLLDAALDL